MRPRDLFLSPQLSSQEIRSFLERYRLEDPEQADRHLQRLADLVGDRERLGALTPSLLQSLSKSVDPDAALLRLAAFFEASPGPLNLTSYLQEHAVALDTLVQILGASPFLAQVLCRNPEYFYWLMEGGRLQTVPSADYFSQQADEITRPFSAIPASMDGLRRLRRRESMRIGAQDLLDLVDLPASVRQISLLADSLLQKVFELLAGELLPTPLGFAVIALGKLGGGELNFSSDVDLLYIYEDESQRELMLRFARQYTRLLTEYTDQGRLYRVDLRLRPMGETGEIAYSLAACRQYYETWADTFDRLALLKCRRVAGDTELGKRFMETAEDFVFKKYFDIAAVEEIRWLKRRADRQLRQRRHDRNIKLGLGGIREIEFFVNAFQLLYGGQHPEIRHPSTLRTLDLLRDGGFISAEDHRLLRDAYFFLRRLEHKLQLVYDIQTHSLPEDKRELARCARRMGYRDGDGESTGVLEQFQRELEKREQAVHRIFASLFETDEKPADLQELVLNPELTQDEAFVKLRAHGVSRPEEFSRGLALLKDAPSYPQSPTRLRNLLANLVPRLIDPVERSRHPERFFARLDRFCESLGSRASLYSELIENETFSRRLLTVLASGEFLAEILIRNPELVDSVSLLPPPQISREEIERLSEREEMTGGNGEIALRLFKQREEFKIGLLDLFATQPRDTRSDLTRLAEMCLQFTLGQLLAQSNDLRKEHFSLLALGKLGGEELTYHSDLDLVLVFDNEKTRVTIEAYHALLRELRRQVEEYTELGRLYQLDFRLRPEGQHGPLAVPFQALRSYTVERAQAWERLAYVKLRPIFSWGESVDAASWVWERPLDEAEVRELAHIRMRKETEIGGEKEFGRYNFKVGHGGLMDIQFVVQYLQIQNRVPETNTRRALQALSTGGFLDQATADTLEAGLKFLTRLETLQRLLEEQSANSISQQPAENRVLALFLGFESGEELIQQYVAETEKIRRIYSALFAS